MDERTIGQEETMSGGTTLLAGRYRVVRPLGQGGMGSVWLAEDTTLDGRLVAVKMLPTVLFANKRAYQQLKSEAMVSLRLTHPNIAVLRSFEENAGNPFLVIDYVDGITLDDYLSDKGTLSEDETVRLLTPVAAALDYAHTQGVVHRDVKPGNVMIAKDGTPYVLDFGIAREIQETMTRVTGKLSSGTLPYMSPEQLNGAAAKPTQDVYSFAAMAYECLTGRPPFSRGQIEFQIEHDQPEELPPEIGIRRTVMEGLAKTAAERPATCAGVLSRSHPAATPSSPRPEPHRFAARRIKREPWYVRLVGCTGPWPLVAIGVALSLAVLAFGVGARREGARRRAVEAVERAAAAERAQLEEAERVKELKKAKSRQKELERKTEEKLKKEVEEAKRAAEQEEVARKLRELSEEAEIRARAKETRQMVEVAMKQDETVLAQKKEETKKEVDIQRAEERRKKAEEDRKRREIEAYRRKYYPEFYDDVPQPESESVDYLKEDMATPYRLRRLPKRRDPLKPPL